MVNNANNTKCRYPITIGRKPKASWLSEGKVEPNCNINLIDIEIEASAINHLPGLGISFFSVGR